MRPSLRHCHHQNASTTTSSSTSAGAGNAPVKALQMAFKKKETEEEMSTRLKSYAYLQKMANEEPWTPLQCDGIFKK